MLCVGSGFAVLVETLLEFSNIDRSTEYSLGTDSHIPTWLCIETTVSL